MKSRSYCFHAGATALGLLLLLLAPTARLRGADVTKILGPDLRWTNGLGSWIWTSNTLNDQTCQLWHTFEIPASGSVTNAQFCITADDEFALFLDGRELGRGVDWRELFVFDLTSLLPPGKHVLAVRAFNSVFEAGVIFGFRANLADGSLIAIKSDKSWRIVPASVKRWTTRTEPGSDWPAATVKAAMGADPWTPWPVNVIMMPALQPVRLAFWQTAGFQISFLILFGLMVLISLRLMAQLALHRKERLLLQQERTRIAREIHDDIGSRMTQLVLRGEVAQCDLPAGSKTQVELVQICEEARSLLATMDEILWAVNPQRDTFRDFESYVCKYAQEFLKPTHIQCLFDVGSETSPAALDLPLRRSLLMAIKETLNNAVKHSNATELRLQIHWQGQRLLVAVQDNGKGFDPAKINSERHGMTNLSQRMKEIGGSCLVASEPGKGCRVEFSVPLKRARKNWRAWISSVKPTSQKLKLNKHQPAK